MYRKHLGIYSRNLSQQVKKCAAKMTGLFRKTLETAGRFLELMRSNVKRERGQKQRHYCLDNFQSQMLRQFMNSLKLLLQGKSKIYLTLYC